MQVNNIENNASFKSKGSIKKMLKLPSTSQAARDINRLTASLVNDVYAKKEIIHPYDYVVSNRTLLNTAKKELGDRLHVDAQLESQIKDETIQVPFQTVVQFLDILSENPQKPISQLIPKMDKNPLLSILLDVIRNVDVSNPEISTMNIMRRKSGGEEYMQAMLIPLRQAFQNNNESLNELINPAKKAIADGLKKEPSSALLLKDRLQKLSSVFKISDSREDMAGVVPAIQKLFSIFVNMAD